MTQTLWRSPYDYERIPDIGHCIDLVMLMLICGLGDEQERKGYGLLVVDWYAKLTVGQLSRCLMFIFL